jgi:hypothetical protein
MKKTAYGTPIIIHNGKEHLLKQIEALDETSIQQLVFKYPSCIPISEIDESYNPVVPVCTELNTPVGPLDILMATPSGELLIIETKLWRNPEARRVVVAQLLDYAKELSRWSYEDLQREINRRLGTNGNRLYEIVKGADSNYLLSESNFVDAVSRNLRRGNFLLLVIGDGIREGAAGIAEFLVSSGHLNFTFAMIELAIYESDKVGQVLLPRVMAKTIEFQKITVDIPAGLQLTNSSAPIEACTNTTGSSPEWERERSFYLQFWTELIAELIFDDPGQPLPNAVYSQNLYVYPGKSRKAWISAYFMKSQKRIGVYFRCQNDPEGQKIYSTLNEDKEGIREELGNEVIWNWEEGDGAGVRLACDDVFDPKKRPMIKDFFKEWLNTFVNVFRPRMKEL